MDISIEAQTSQVEWTFEEMTHEELVTVAEMQHSQLTQIREYLTLMHHKLAALEQANLILTNNLVEH